jgi:hypothetical protein
MIAPNSSIAYDNYNENATVSGACFVATCPSTLPVLPNSHEATGHVCTATGHGGLCNATCANVSSAYATSAVLYYNFTSGDA